MKLQLSCFLSCPLPSNLKLVLIMSEHDLPLPLPEDLMIPMDMEVDSPDQIQQSEPLPMTEDAAGLDGIWWLPQGDAPSLRRPSRNSSAADNAQELMRIKRCTNCHEIIKLGWGNGLNAYDAHFKKVRCIKTAASNAQTSQMQPQKSRSHPLIKSWTLLALKAHL
ncbi:hypothetical protein CPB84DRAFT_881995 [Gymnopilus junonius]|uniref:Uncharacterized protein n=1 Tax=Gymnopilus junonius TaxID=109634 RepID=A0A9P5N7M9_GYMJU|nr:hypothetical protein CPB84DRAFT_881995 [Gymnopilus junonius]